MTNLGRILHSLQKLRNAIQSEVPLALALSWSQAHATHPNIILNCIQGEKGRVEIYHIVLHLHVILKEYCTAVMPIFKEQLVKNPNFKECSGDKHRELGSSTDVAGRRASQRPHPAGAYRDNDAG